MTLKIEISNFHTIKCYYLILYIHRRSTRSAWSGHLLGTIQAFSNSMVFPDQYYGPRVKNMPRAPRNLNPALIDT